MILQVENKSSVQVKSFSQVEKKLRSLKSYGPSSYAIMTNQTGEYLQVAGGRVTCVVEHGIPKNEILKRAYLTNPKVSFRGPQTLVFGGGELQMEPDEILFIDDVIELFSSFYHSKPLDIQVKWRDMSKVLNE